MLAHLRAKRRKVAKSTGTDSTDPVDQDSDHAHFYVGSGSNISSSHASLPTAHTGDFISQENYFSGPVSYDGDDQDEDLLEVQEEDPAKSCSGVSFASLTKSSKRNEKSVSM
jgi:hypothetical protein